MESRETLLYSIYKNAQMGVEAISQLIPMTKDDEFRRHITAQQREYQEIMNKSTRILLSRGHKPRSTGRMAKAGLEMSTAFNVAVDDSTSHLAEMMIQGSTMGITKITRRMNNAGECDPQVDKLARQLLETEENNVAQLRQFL